MNATILIVEDDHALRRAIARWASQQDMKVLEAESAEEATMLLENQAVDLVILDMRLPGMSGLTFAEALIETERERPVLLMTAFADLDSARQAMNIGVYEYFAKPFEFDDIRASIHRALQHRQLLLENQAHQAHLEQQVQHRTEALTRINDQLQREIEERKRAEKALRDSEAQQRLITDSLPVMVAYVDQAQYFRFINRQYEKVFDVDRHDVIGKKVCDVLGDAYGQAKIYIDQVLAGETVTFEMPTAPTSDRILSVTFVPHEVENSSVQGFFALIIDVTERKRIQNQVIQLERLGALAEMSAGVSHNLNNILTGILGPAQLIEMHTQDPKVLREAETIRLAAIRAADLVTRLSQSVSGENDMPFPVDLGQAIKQAVKVAQPRWKDEPEAMGVRIDLVVDVQSVATVRATPGGLHNVLLNLIFNAVDAMPDGGTLTLSAVSSSFGVRLSVSDTGIGMSEDVRRRVFEPFFTTKAAVGTGLGMSAVFTAVSSWDGRIDLRSAPGQGTTVVVDLPLWKEAYLSEKVDEVRSERAGAILVVEDEEMVRGFLSRALSRVHRVDAVADGPAALARFGDQSYDVVLVDLGMPGMPGDRVAVQMRQRDPRVATVLITGWDLPEGDPRLEIFDYHLKKPFGTVEEILLVVAQAVARRDARAAQQD